MFTVSCYTAIEHEYTEYYLRPTFFYILTSLELQCIFFFFIRTENNGVLKIEVMIDLVKYSVNYFKQTM